MNKDNIKDYWHLLEAMKDGKIVQTDSSGKWRNMLHLNFNLPPENYRIKPEPVVKEIWVNVYEDGRTGPSRGTVQHCDEFRRVDATRTAYIYTRIEDDELVEQKLIPSAGEE